MASGISAEQARDIITYHKVLEAHISRTRKLKASERAELVAELDREIASGAFQRRVALELAGTKADQESTSFPELIEPLDWMLAASPALQKLERTESAYRSYIEDRVEQMGPLLSVLKRAFTGRQKKEAAAAAYEELCALRDGDYSRFVNESIAYLESKPQPGTRFQVSEAARRTLFSTLVRGHAPVFIPEVQSALGVQGRLELLEETIAENEAASRNQVKAAAEALLGASAKEALAATPVSELAKGRKGLRVKPLRDDGFESVADVLASTTWRLAECRGISDDGAVTLMASARQIERAARSRAKIRLNADRRTSESTSLVSALVSCASNRALLKEAHAAIAQARATSSPEDAWLPLKNLDAILWPVMTKDEKDSLSSAYQSLLVSNAVALTTEELLASRTNKIRSLTGDAAWDAFARNPIPLLDILEELVPGALGSDDGIYGLPGELAREITEQPLKLEGLKCKLRRYQEWGVKYVIHQKRALLGDEMGLGKTIEAIAAMVHLRNDGGAHFLVVCPASVLTNWQREVEKNSGLKAHLAHGPYRDLAVSRWKRGGGVAITSYETLGSLEISEETPIDLLVVDEAHFVKNPTAKRSRNVSKLCQSTKRALFMTGTALENNVGEMMVLIGMLRPSLATGLEEVSEVSTAAEFREQIAPVYFRRKRDDVLTELPDLIEKKEWCILGEEEKWAYAESLGSGNVMQIRRVSWNVSDPQLSSKAKRLGEIVRDAAEDGRKVIVFSFFLETIRIVQTLFEERCVGVINGSVPTSRRQQIIDDFDKAPAGSILAAQIQAGGTGLNIQSASVVVICEPQLKPSIENQAISRAYRMGQARNVLVFRLLASDTIDERFDEILSRKQGLFDAFADKSRTADETLEIDKKTLSRLVEEERARVAQETPAARQPLPAADEPRRPAHFPRDRKFCQHCGRKLEPGYSFCPYCGGKLS